MSENWGGDACGVLLPLYRAARELAFEEFQILVLRLLEEGIRFDSGRWGTAVTDLGTFELRSQYLFREPPTIPSEYAEVKDQDLLAQAVTKGNGTTVSATTSQCFKDKAFAGIRDYTRRHEHRNSLMSASRDPGTGLMYWVSLYRAGEDDAFAPRERSILGQLLPHLREAMTISQQLHLARLKAGPGTVYCAAVDRSGLIHHADADFLALAAEEFGPAGKRALPPAVVAGLYAQVRCVGRVMTLDGRSGGEMIFVKARPTSGVDRLSRRELQVARLAARGLSHKEIALQLGLSPATARTHLQHIHEKLATHSVVEIANRLWESE